MSYTYSTEPFYILWNPNSELPPRVTFKTRAEAVEVAELMARRNPTETFCVMRAVGEARADYPPVAYTTYGGKKK